MKPLFLALLLGSLPLFAGTLTFEEPTQEIHAGTDAKTVTADFKFKNESSEEVVIDHYDAACTCISAGVQNGKMVYQAGESGVIRAAFDMSHFSGTTDKSLMVWLKGDPKDKPSITLTARVVIPVLVEVEPKTLIWESGSPAEPKTVTITMKHSEPIRVTSISGADQRFVQVLRTVEEGKKYEVVVTPAQTSGVGMGVIGIETDCPVQRFRSQRIFAVLRHPLPKPVAKP
jgi:hypothetical protein